MRPLRIAALCLAMPALARAQYVGRVGQANLDQKPVLRATAVYQYTGSMAKPNASRLVPVVVWDGTRFQPGGVYLAQPEPLAVAPGTQYVLTPKGVPAGLFNVLSAAQQNGAWVALGRYAVPAPPPPPPKLRASRDFPQLHGGHIDEDQDAGGGPILHRHAGSAGDAQSSSGGSASDSTASDSRTSPKSSTPSGGGSDAPVLHRREGSASSSSPSSSTSDSASSSGSSAPPTDPDRPVLHRPAGGSASSSTTPTALDPDRPMLHRHAGAEGGDVVIAPDPDRPHLRYGRATQGSLVLPVLLETKTDLAPGTPVVIDQVVAVSDIDSDPPHNFGYEWPSEVVRNNAEQGLHDVAVRTLAAVVTASFGPGAAADEELRKAAAAQQNFPSGPATAPTPAAQAPAAQAKHVPKPATSSRRKPKTVPTAAPPAAPPAPPTDPLVDPEFHAFTLSYGGGTAWIYSAHTRAEGGARRYVTVIAAPDFYGKPQVLFKQTTRGDTLDQTPALHLIDAVDADGDHRAELLFAEQTGVADDPASARQFALFRVVDGQATEVYATPADVTQ